MLTDSSHDFFGLDVIFTDIDDNTFSDNTNFNSTILYKKMTGIVLSGKEGVAVFQNYVILFHITT